jgi:hypothetical protein
MTGRAGGYCAGFDSPGFMNPYGGRLGAGFRRGRGRGRGVPHPAWGSWGSPYGAYPYAPPYSAEQEKDALQGQVKFFEDQLMALRERIEELEKDTTKTE